MLKKITLLVYFAYTATLVVAQDNDNSLKGVPWRERIITGGGLGLSFSSNQDFFAINPLIGYTITKKFAAGTGASYQYVKFKNLGGGQSISINNYGLNPFARYTVYEGFFAHAEYEWLSFEQPIEGGRKNFNSFLAGGGLLQPIGNRSSFFVMVLYNFSYRTPQPTEFTPYNSPIVIRAGVNLGGVNLF
jgi:hypothetical protein